MIYKCGEKPGKGKYRCVQDGNIIILDEDTDRLPPCKTCNSCEWEKIS